ncbi:PASTA domain-containing protein [Streptomyces xylophagus]|uniref:PASTA domain-containing protein n=1 Tax=Streptomyces xylophagus TaxID=285514 RepID=UPI00068AB1FA|nr:PASTA domain-containing protein [Streptomyces xylophagus]
MTGYVSPPSDGRDGDISLAFLEQELVTALNDFAGTSPTPHFDATSIKKRTRRRRAGFVAAVSAVLVAAGVGTALAGAGTGSHTARPAAHTTTTKTTTPEKGNVTTVPYVKPFDLGGVPLATAEKTLTDAGLKVGTITHGAVDNCKPGSVITVSPLAPTVLHGGEKVDLGICG